MRKSVTLLRGVIQILPSRSTIVVLRDNKKICMCIQSRKKSTIFVQILSGTF